MGGARVGGWVGHLVRGCREKGGKPCIATSGWQLEVALQEPAPWTAVSVHGSSNVRGSGWKHRQESTTPVACLLHCLWASLAVLATNCRLYVAIPGCLPQPPWRGGWGGTGERGCKSPRPPAVLPAVPGGGGGLADPPSLPFTQQELTVSTSFVWLTAELQHVSLPPLAAYVAQGVDLCARPSTAPGPRARRICNAHG